MQLKVTELCLFLVFTNSRISAQRSCTCENEQNNSSEVIRGLQGKRGPPGPPGDVIQCGCNTSEVLEQLKEFTTEINTFKGNDNFFIIRMRRLLFDEVKANAKLQCNQNIGLNSCEIICSRLSN